MPSRADRPARSRGQRGAPPPVGPDGVVEVAAGLVERDGRLLVTRRPAGTHLGGFWEFPGGKREPGESFEACLARELREEVGIEVAVGEEVRRVRHAYPERTIEMRFFRCRIVAGEPRPLQVAALAWVAPAELGAYPFPPADQDVVDWLSTKWGQVFPQDGVRS